MTVTNNINSKLSAALLSAYYVQRVSFPHSCHYVGTIVLIMYHCTHFKDEKANTQLLLIQHESELHGSTYM